MDAQAGRRFFHTVTFEFTEQAALSWYLTNREIQSIKDRMIEKKNKQRLDDLVKWWKTNLLL